eukprot:gene10315-7033_t
MVIGTTMVGGTAIPVIPAAATSAATTLTVLESDIFKKLTALTALDLSDNQLTVLESDIFKDLTALPELYLDGNQLTVLESDLFNNLTALTALAVADNQLTVLESDIFKNLTALTTLSLYGNQLTVLESDIFKNLTALTYLDLGGNQLTVLEIDIFKTLPALTTLRLGGNQLTVLESDLFKNLIVLTELNLHDNHLTVLESDIFKNLTALTELYLYDNQLTVLESDIFKDLTALPELYLDGNQLTVLESDLFNNLTALTALAVADNQLTVLESDIFKNLTALTTLRLGGNQLTVLESDIFKNLTALTELYLYDNQLTVLEIDIFKTLPALTYLDLGGNQLTVLEIDIFKNLTALTELYLYDNQLTVLESDLFKTLTALTELYLFDNQLTVLESDIFKNLTALTRLSLHDNQLTVLESDIFKNLTALTELYLYDNQLTVLESDLFQNLTALTTLDLNDNQFTQPPDTIFASLTKLAYLDLSKNQLIAINSPTFAPVTRTIQRLYLADNLISQVDSVLAEMQQHNLTTLTMEGNPSRCSVATKTNKNLKGSIVCTCAVGFEHINIVDSTIIGHSDESDGEDNGGYLCQVPLRAVIVPQTVATLRSQFVLSGPEEQLAAPTRNTTKLDRVSFIWNGYSIDVSDVDVSLHWLNNSRATFSWDWTPASVWGNGSKGDIRHPPPSKGSTTRIGEDSPVGYATINYNVNATTANDTSLKHHETTAEITLVYSAFHWPARFDKAFANDTRNVTVGSGLQVPRTFRIQESTTAAAVSNASNTSNPNTYEMLSTTANVPVEANPFIPTSIEFKLADNTCQIKHSADVLNIRRIYSNADEASGARSNTVVGWEVVVGEPDEIAKAKHLHNGTMEPCTAVLQAYDAVTTEVLNITTIEASIQDCWDNSTIHNAGNAGYLSCNGHGSCTPDDNPYDGTFLGCECDPEYGGQRCEVKLKSCSSPQGFNIQTQKCETFNFVPNIEYREGTVPDKKYETLKTVNHAFFTENETLWIRGVSIDETLTKVSSGTVDDITYKLEGAPPGFFLSSDNNGEIFGYLSMNGTSEEKIEYTVKLFAVDANSVKVLVDEFSLTVQKDKSKQTKMI